MLLIQDKVVVVVIVQPVDPVLRGGDPALLPLRGVIAAAVAAAAIAQEVLLQPVGEGGGRDAVSAVGILWAPTTS